MSSTCSLNLKICGGWNIEGPVYLYVRVLCMSEGPCSYKEEYDQILQGIIAMVATILMIICCKYCVL